MSENENERVNSKRVMTESNITCDVYLLGGMIMMGMSLSKIEGAPFQTYCLFATFFCLFMYILFSVRARLAGKIINRRDQD